MEKFLNRQEAGKILAQSLQKYAGKKDVIVLGLPRGGVPVAYEIAHSLKRPLDVFIVRKLGVPWHKELAFGAIAVGGVTVFNEDIVQEIGLRPEEINAVIAEETKELARRERFYRGTAAFPSLKNKIVILVDDGIATGATIRAAIAALRQLDVAKIIVAVPCAQRSLCQQLSRTIDELICPLQPASLYAVGVWYDDFSQTEDEEVTQLLMQARENISTEKE